MGVDAEGKAASALQAAMQAATAWDERVAALHARCTAAAAAAADAAGATQGRENENGESAATGAPVLRIAVP